MPTRFSLFCLMVAVLGLEAHGRVRLVGSDLLGPQFSEKAVEAARSGNLEVTVALDGSRSGWEQLSGGNADAGLFLFAPGEAKPESPWVSLPVAYHVAMVAVADINPVRQITIEQLGGIFGAGERANLVRWGDFGLTGDWVSRPIAAKALEAGAGISISLFRHIALSGAMVKPTVVRYSSLDGVVEALRKEPGSIAIVPAVPVVLSRSKVLPVAANQTAIAYAPTPEAVHRHDYPLSLPIWLVFKNGDAGKMLPLLKYFFSDEAAADLQAAGLVPLPSAARDQTVFEIEFM